MNQIIIEGPELTNARFQVKNIDEAIEKLLALKKSKQRDHSHSFQRFKGIVESAGIIEGEWYLQ